MKSKLYPNLALLTAAIIWGSSFVMVKDTVELIPPSLLLTVRFLIATIILSVVFYKKIESINFEYIKKGAFVGLLLFLAFFTQTVGITDTTASKNAFLTAVYCVIVPLIYWVIGRGRPDRFNISAALLTLIGIGLVSLSGSFTIEFGDAATLLGGFFFAAHIVAVSVLFKESDPVLATIMQFFFVALYSGITSIFTVGEAAIVWNGDVWFSIIYLAALCSAGGLLLQNIGQKYTSPAAASILLSLESVFGVAFSVFMFGEQITGRIALGFVVIFIAVIISETKLAFLWRK